MAKRKLQAVHVENPNNDAQPLDSFDQATEESSDDGDLAFDESLAESYGRVRAYKGHSDDDRASKQPGAHARSQSSTLTGSEVDSEEDDDFRGASSEDPSASEPGNESHDMDLDDVSDDEIRKAKASISFGALAKAQSQLDPMDHSNRAHRISGAEQDDVNDLEAEALERKSGKKDSRDFSRQSKHAPTELSSKKAVSRKRSVVAVPKVHVRDPRFDSIAGKVNANQIKKNYAFLSEYQDAEIAELKSGIRKTKDPKAKATMEKALKSMESRRRTQKLDEQRQEIVREFRKEEGKKVKEGKRPFFLKNSEIKKRALEQRLKGMKARDRTKAIERRRKKITAKERKDMPLVRRE